jgi:NNP family nitrate/nitrite transporter-like MFS transporter
MLPAFFADTWSLGPAAAGIAASAFAFMNLVARPGGGLLSDLGGSRRRTLTALSAGLVAGYALLASLGPAWPWGLAVIACMACSFFVQAGEGATYAIVPLVQKRVSGQISGLVGAYGNVGAVAFLTLGLFVPAQVFFLVIAGTALAATVACRFLIEPEHSFALDLVAEEGATWPVPDRLAGPASESTDPDRTSVEVFAE